MILSKTQALAAAFAASLLIGTTAGPAARAQAPLVEAAPLTTMAQNTPPPGPTTATELAGQRALDTGLPSIAAEIFQELLDNPAAVTTPAARNRLVLSLATALIEDDRVDEAAKALQQFSGEPTAAVKLRQAMIDVRQAMNDTRQLAGDARQRRFASARAIAAALRPDDLPPQDRGWLFFLRGMLAEEARDIQQATAFYAQAEAAMTTAPQRTWFELARRRTALLLGQASESTLETYSNAMKRYAGSANDYAAASSYAVALNMLGRRTEALNFLQGRLLFLAPQETAARDEWLFLIGLIAGANDNAGREALERLLANSGDPRKQRAALRLLANASRTKDRSGGFQNMLDRLIASVPPHPILDDLLLFRAQFAFAAKDYNTAENDANRLRAEFPALRASALGILTGVAWERGAYRAAASWASEARAQQGLPQNTRAQLGVLVAEAWFRAGDFRNASDAYGSALKDVPEGVSAGTLMFQRVFSEMQTGSNGATLAGAQKILDEYAADPRFDAVSRWQAEWNLARELQAAQQTRQAYARVNALLEGSAQLPAGFPADLRARMSWLQARLAYDSGEYAQAILLAEKLIALPGGMEPALREDVASMTMLLEIEAGYALVQSGQPSPVDTAKITEKLRAEFPKSDAAMRSYFVEADIAANRDQLVVAQGLMRKLADDYRGTPYASYALYQAALYAERRGQETYFLDANKLLEELITEEEKKQPRNDGLIFQARMTQGNILRRLGQHGLASKLYDGLVETYKFPQYPEALAAELARADCYAMMKASDASRAESAAAIYERLLDQPTAPVALRVEAGHKFGLNLIERKEPARLVKIWWQMINDFLLVDAQAAKLGESATGNYWMARTLLVLGEVLEQQGKMEEARNAYSLIISKNLPGVALAQARLSGAGR